MLRLISILVVSGFVAGCNNSKKDSQIQELATTSILGKQFYAPYCIYLLDEKNAITVDEIKNLASKYLPEYKLVDSLSDKIGSGEYIIEWSSDPENEYPAPDLDYLSHTAHGLTDHEMNQLQSPFAAVLIAFSGTNKNVLNDQVAINQLISSLIQKSSAIVMDYTTYESFNSKSWEEDRASNFNETNQDITSQFTIHLYRENEFCRAVTLGLGKFCLPDISIQNLSCRNEKSFGSLINLICQTMLERPVIRVDTTMVVDITALMNDSVKTRLINSLGENATKSALINLSLVEPQQGDAYNTQYEIVFTNRNYSSEQEEQEVLISRVFGSTDQIEYVNHDEKILQASQRAKEKLPYLRSMFTDGLEPGYSILLKGPFETDKGGREWMWIEVTAWTDDSIKGILQNDPYEISGLSAGSIVSINQNDVFDYILYLPDGSTEGNETGKIIGGEE